MILPIFTSYSIIRPLGQGGMATVYLAEHQLLGNKVAIKVLNNEFVRNENIRKRFLAEARNMARMSHPNIIKVTDLIDDGDTVAFVMEYIDGETLKDYLDKKRKLPDENIKQLFTQMLDAVGYVHSQGLVHRDIKPSNFMISGKGVIKLLDFGIAKNTDNSSAEYTMTGTAQNMGTPMYMSPEQVKSTKDVTAQSDIYSLGVVLWQMVMGRKPYDSSSLSTFELQSKIVNEQLQFTETSWDTVIQIATHKELSQRYISTSELLIGKRIKSDADSTNTMQDLETTTIEDTKKQVHDTLPVSTAKGTSQASRESTSITVKPRSKKSWIGKIAILSISALSILLFVVILYKLKNKSINDYSELINEYQLKGDTIGSVNIMKEAINNYPEDQSILVQIINYYITRGKSEEAIGYLDKAIAKEKDNPSFYLAKGVALDRLGRQEDAIKEYEQAIKVKADCSDAYYNIGVIYFNRGVKLFDIANAVPTIEQALFETKKKKADYQFSMAVPYFEKAVQYNPNDTYIREQLKNLYYRLKIMDKYENMP